MDYAKNMNSIFMKVIHGGFLISGVTLVVGIFSTFVIAQEFDTGRSLNYESMAERTPHAWGSAVKSQLKRPAPGARMLAPPSGEAIAAPGSKSPSMGGDQSSGPAVIDDLPLTSARRISIKMHNYPGLTGDYRINADDTVSIPALGRIQVTRMTAAGLEQVIRQKTKIITGNQANVSVEVAEYSPVFVNGYVDKAGSIPWTPGMTVLQAETLAGGLYRPRAGSLSGSTDPDVERIKHLTEIKRLTNDLKHTLTNLARASAERANVTQVDVPQRLVELVGNTEAKELIDIQKKRLHLRLESFAAERARLAQATTLEADQLAQLKKQQELVRKQIDMRDKQLRLLRGARLKGAITQERLLSVESLLASLQEKSTNIIVADARVQSAAVSLQSEIERLIQGRQLAVAAEIAKLERDAAQLEIELVAAHEGYASFARLTGEVFSSEGNKKTSVVQYEITRQEERKASTILAERLTPLWPGDILVISVRTARIPLAQSQ